ADPDAVPSFFEISETRIPLRYNIAPSQIAPVIVGASDGSRQLVHMEWGIAGEILGLQNRSNRLINVRSETIGKRKIFRPAFTRRRCLVPASGFFEWRKEGKQRLPFYFYPSQDPLLGLAGIWETRPEGNPPVFAILTRPAIPIVAVIHDRMPATLARKCFNDWLEPDTSEERLEEILSFLSSVPLDSHPVSTLVNNPLNDREECIRPSSPPGKLF